MNKKNHHDSYRQLFRYRQLFQRMLITGMHEPSINSDRRCTLTLQQILATTTKMTAGELNKDIFSRS